MADVREDLRKRVNTVFFKGNRTEDGSSSTFSRGNLSITVTRSGSIIDTVDVRRDISPGEVDLYRYQRIAGEFGVYGQALYDINGNPKQISFPEFVNAFNRAYEKLLVFSPDGVNEGIRKAQEESAKPGFFARLFGKRKTPAPRKAQENKNDVLLIGSDEQLFDTGADEEFDALFRE